ncbi:MAG: tRNA uridine-5-carboxymethylaminomethyl(34) synthesis GTPase MnmE [Ruminococcus sp.]|nr:tRNA uridine-5-carboxymethylaminomethyl(34) synthesis GTPase MnmE [Ruminococcus sp.]
MESKETIAAISTGMTNSGISIVRISGDEAFLVIDKIYRGKATLSGAMSHTIHYGFIVDMGDTIDEVLVSIMRAPRTFTGEDTVEINCHGGMFVTQKILATVIKNGARLAQPGEFTKRAFLNGKMDLTQAESVMDVIQSQNEYALHSSIGQLKGNLKRKIEGMREMILYHTAYIETALDDPEHVDMENYGKELLPVIEKISEDVRRLIESADAGRIMKEGINTVILGKPNVGKSSLLNALSGYDRAIVTNIEGTTRDVLEEQVRVGGIVLNLMDTAGIRETSDEIEKIGVDRALKYAEDADLILYVVDASRSLDENDEKILDYIYDRKFVILLNKSDLNVQITQEILQNRIKEKYEENFIINISAKNGTGIEEFVEMLKKICFRGELRLNEEVYITNLRQKEALQRAREALGKVEESIGMGMPEDFYSIDMMDAYEALGTITGETVGEDLINEIFSKFCMGK